MWFWWFGRSVSTTSIGAMSGEFPYFGGSIKYRVPNGQWQLSAGGTQRWSDEARRGDVYRCWRQLPAPVRESMPVVAGPSGVFLAPLLAYNVKEIEKSADCDVMDVQMAFSPRRPLSISGFSIANWV